MDQSNVDKKVCTLILLDDGLCRDLRCDNKHTEKTEKYFFLITALKKYWGGMEFVAIPIRHADT
jgi:hypothetical protein